MRLKQQGYTLLELALTLVVGGLIVTIGASLYHHREQTLHAEVTEIQFEGADQALLGYIFAHNLLPCPTTDNSGIEQRELNNVCTTTQGFFPFRTLGMAQQLRNSAGAALHYVVFDNPDANLPNDAALSMEQDRFRPFYADNNISTPQQRIIGNSNSLDLCHALLTAQDPNINRPDTALHINDGQNDQHVAYLLIDPGTRDGDNDQNMLDGLNATANPQNLLFQAPGTPKSLTNDDRVHATYFSQLYQQMGCTEFMAAAGTAHPNVLSTATLIQLAMEDQRKQLILTTAVAAADILQSAAAVSSALGGVASGGASLANAITEALLTSGAKAGDIVIATASIVTATIGSTSAILTTAASIAAQVLAAENLIEYDKLKNKLEKQDGLIDTIRQNVRNADGRGIYQ